MKLKIKHVKKEAIKNKEIKNNEKNHRLKKAVGVPEENLNK